MRRLTHGIFATRDNNMNRLTLLLAALLLAAAPLHAQVKLEIGPDTTIIDGPLNPDGTINYLAYLNEKLSEGVTPENNFAVDVALSMPAEFWPSEAYRLKVLKTLGIEDPNAGRPFLNFYYYLASVQVERSLEETSASKVATTERPWNGEYPLVKQWLDSQSDVLDILARSIHKSCFYFPLIPEDGKPAIFSSCSLQWQTHSRGIAWALGARSQWRVGADDLDGAWRDAMLLNKLSRRLMSQGLLIDVMIGTLTERYALLVIPQIASSKKLTPEVTRLMIRDLSNVEPASRYIGVFHVDARLGTLCTVQDLWKGRIGVLGDFEFYDPRVFKLAVSTEFDPNVTLRAVNRDMDTLLAALKIPGFPERRQALADYDTHCASMRTEAENLLSRGGDVSAEVDRLIRESNVVTAAATLFVLSPKQYITQQQIDGLETQSSMHRELALVALAIGGYHAEHGEYPPDLHALVPAYLDTLPTDFATGELPVYRVEGGAAIVYSLGTDLEDDGGVDDPNDGDIVFRIQR